MLKIPILYLGVTVCLPVCGPTCSVTLKLKIVSNKLYICSSGYVAKRSSLNGINQFFLLPEQPHILHTSVIGHYIERDWPLAKKEHFTSLKKHS